MSRNDVRERLHTFICGEVILDPCQVLADDEPLFTGGLIDSFSLAYIATFIERFFGVCIPDSDLTVEHMDTLGRIVDRVLRNVGSGVE